MACIEEVLTYEVQHPMPRLLPDGQDSQIFYPVVLERSDEPFTDLERHLAAAFSRD